MLWTWSLIVIGVFVAGLLVARHRPPPTAPKVHVEPTAPLRRPPLALEQAMVASSPDHRPKRECPGAVVW